MTEQASPGKLTRAEFKKAMRRGLGRCCLALTGDAGRAETYREIVLWGCLHPLAYDAQCEGTRAEYLYRLVSRFPDQTYFLDGIAGRGVRLPRECFLWIYEQSLCSCCRERAVREMGRRRWLTPEMLRECRYDSSERIAAYAESALRRRQEREGESDHDRKI